MCVCTLPLFVVLYSYRLHHSMCVFYDYIHKYVTSPFSLYVERDPPHDLRHPRFDRLFQYRHLQNVVRSIRFPNRIWGCLDVFDSPSPTPSSTLDQHRTKVCFQFDNTNKLLTFLSRKKRHGGVTHLS